MYYILSMINNWIIKAGNAIDRIPYVGDTLAFIGQIMVSVLYYAIVFPVLDFINWLIKRNQFILVGSDGSLVFVRNIAEAEFLTGCLGSDIRTLKRKSFSAISTSFWALKGDNDIFYQLASDVDWEDWWDSIAPPTIIVREVHKQSKALKLSLAESQLPMQDEIKEEQ